MTYGAPGYVVRDRIDELEDRLYDLKADIVDARAERDKALEQVDDLDHERDTLKDRVESLENLLLDIREWMDNRADADHDGETFVANDEMQWAMRITAEVAP
jgi:uncharacterized coiled-coil DUF342 family protein